MRLSKTKRLLKLRDECTRKQNRIHELQEMVDAGARLTREARAQVRRLEDAVCPPTALNLPGERAEAGVVCSTKIRQILETNRRLGRSANAGRHLAAEVGMFMARMDQEDTPEQLARALEEYEEGQL